MTKAKLVTGLFKSKIAAESAVDAILKRGFTRDDISVLMSDATRSKEFALQTRSHAADGLGIGSALGGAVGAVLAQVDPAPQTRTSVEQGRLSMNAPPALLMDELDRLLQSEWTDRIPNRRYAFACTAKSGSHTCRNITSA